MSRFVKGNLSRRHQLFMGLMFAAPGLILAAKFGMFGHGEWWRELISLKGSMAGEQRRLYYVLQVPLGALIIVFFRLVLGIRILGPFRSILLAVAFQITGIPAGCIFLGAVMVVVVLVRPVLKSMRLPYFARVSVLLSTVAAIMIFVFLAGRVLEARWLNRLIYFPIFALCLTGEGFARTLNKEGMVSAVWRGAFTVVVAIVITLVGRIGGLHEFLVDYPEMLVVQIATMVLISEMFDMRILERFNPPARKRLVSSGGELLSVGIAK